MRGSYQPVRFPGNPDEGPVLRELKRLELSRRPLPLSVTLLRRFSRLLQAPTLELECIVRCIECDPLLAISVLRLVADELAGVDLVRISDCIVIAGRERLRTLAESENLAPAGIPAMDVFGERSRGFSLIASRLAASTNAVDPAVARLAGLLHALGELPILLSGRSPDRYSPATIAGWGKRLARSWHLPSALVSAIAAYDPQVSDGTPDPVQLIIRAAHCLVHCHAREAAPATVFLLNRGGQAREAARYKGLVEARQER